MRIVMVGCGYVGLVTGVCFAAMGNRVCCVDTDAAKIAHEALSQAWGVPSVNIGVGGSIPFISTFQEQFPSAQVIVTGVEDPLTNAHSENESQDLGDLKNAILAEALMLQKFAEKA